MDKRFLLCQLDVTFCLRDIDVAVITVLEAIEEIKAAEFAHAPFDTRLRSHMTQVLHAVLPLVLRYVECVLQFDPQIGLHGFAGNDELRTDTAAEQPIVLILLQQIDAIRTHVA